MLSKGEDKKQKFKEKEYPCPVNPSLASAFLALLTRFRACTVAPACLAPMPRQTQLHTLWLGAETHPGWLVSSQCDSGVKENLQPQKHLTR